MELLRQATRLLESMGSADYLAAGRIGPQLRHILEFYECFLGGTAIGVIDYDARRRDESLETSQELAIRKIHFLCDQLSQLASDKILQVRMEDASPDMANALLPSSISRELQVLASHTTHHFALIAMMLSNHGRPVEPDFGVARSTMRHRLEAAKCAQ